MNGTVYTIDEFVVHASTENHDITFGRIEGITIDDDNNVRLLIQIFKTEDFSEHFNCYVVKETVNFCIINIKDLPTYICMHPNFIQCFPSSYGIVMKFIV